MGEHDQSPSDSDDGDDDRTRPGTSGAELTPDDGESWGDDWEWETGTAADSSDPLGEFARDVRDRSRQSSDADDLFESVEVEEIDSETVWSSIEDADPGESADPGVGASPADEAAVAVDLDEWDDAAGPEEVVPRADFCTRCEYLADPPTLACTHEGTDIVEVVDHEHFLVRACPFVEAESVGPTDDTQQ
jgi:hypothetical protein